MTSTEYFVVCLSVCSLSIDLLLLWLLANDFHIVLCRLSVCLSVSWLAEQRLIVTILLLANDFYIVLCSLSDCLSVSSDLLLLWLLANDFYMVLCRLSIIWVAEQRLLIATWGAVFFSFFLPIYYKILALAQIAI